MYDMKRIKKICSNFTVLLVDDEEGARIQVCDILTLFFASVFVAKNGEEAYEVYKNNKPDIIITDLTMPRIDGFELIRLVRFINIKQKSTT